MKCRLTSKQVKIKKGEKAGQKFEKYLLIVNNRCFSCNVTEDCKKELIKADLEMPVDMELTDKDYFIKKETYITKQGVQQENYKFVLQHIGKATQGEYEAISIDDIMKDIEKEAVEAEAKK